MEKKLDMTQVREEAIKASEIIKENESSLVNQLNDNVSSVIDSELSNNNLATPNTSNFNDQDKSQNKEIENLIKMQELQKNASAEQIVIMETFTMERVKDDNGGKSEKDMPYQSVNKLGGNDESGNKNENSENDKVSEKYILYHNKVLISGKILKEPLAVYMKPPKPENKPENKLEPQDKKEMKMYEAKVKEEDKENEVESKYGFLNVDNESQKAEFLQVKKYADGRIEKTTLEFDAFNSDFVFNDIQPNPGSTLSNTENKIPKVANKDSVLANIRGINKEYGAWRESNEYKDLPQNHKEEISHSAFLQKAYDYAFRGNVAGLSALMKKNQDKTIDLEQLNSVALAMSVSGGNQGMVRHLINSGADPRGINLNNITSPELKEYLKQEAHKREHPVLSTLGIKAK